VASTVGICNRGLQKLGATRITSLDEDSVNARACNACFEELKQSEIRKHKWRFAIDRVELAADASSPAFGKENSFTLPADCLRVIAPYPEMNLEELDWEIEGGKIYTNDDDPLYVRYLKNITDPNLMDPTFREALAARIALELCEQLTQSNTKKAELKEDYKDSIRDARKANAIESVPARGPEDSWVTGRS
jgi:hypothetical protein